MLVFVGFCWVFFVTGSFLNKLMGQQANPVYQGHITLSTSLSVEPVPVWGVALALDIWCSGVRCLRDMAKTLLKVMVRTGVSRVTFLSLHLSAF